MRKLKGNEIELRAARSGKSSNGAWCQLLAYKTSRVDMDLLDEEYGPMNWKNEYKRDSDGILQCGIAVKDAETREWVWKWSCGTESNQDSQKGEYSDALKRAGFLWGIGRELYHFPTVFITLSENEYYMRGDKVVAKCNFRDWNIDLSEGVRIMDEKGTVRFSK